MRGGRDRNKLIYREKVQNKCKVTFTIIVSIIKGLLHEIIGAWPFYVVRLNTVMRTLYKIYPFTAWRFIWVMASMTGGRYNITIVTTISGII